MLGGAVVYVGDLGRMRLFYERCFGWTVTDQADDFCGMQSPAGLITLVRSVDAVPATSPPPRRTRTPIKLVVEVRDIAALRAAIDAAGGRVDPVHAQWRFRGSTHCDAVDPEGNVIQLVEVRAEEG